MYPKMACEVLNAKLSSQDNLNAIVFSKVMIFINKTCIIDDLGR